MELKVEKAFQDGVEIPDNFIITEILDGVDAFDNPMKIKGESGQHTIASILGNVDSIETQIETLFETKGTWIDKETAVMNFLKNL